MAANISDLNSITTVVSNVNSLYDNLITYTVGLIAFVGAFIPAALALIQRRQFVKERAVLLRELEISIDEKIQEKEGHFKDFIESIIKK